MSHDEYKYVNIIKRYIRAANYISAAQIYLGNNVLLQDKLLSEHIKPRLLGHWGTAPGINFVYAHFNYALKKTNKNAIFVLGPGHGLAAIQANLYLEGSLIKYYEKATEDEEGLRYIVKNFSWPYGFPSHCSPATPGVILEGGELGYSLSTAYGAVLDNRNTIAVCMVGDGEAETGPLATSWHLNKFINPRTSGFVLPILHLNGYKISGPTVFGRMSDADLISLFTGYGYKPIIIQGENIEDDELHLKMMRTLDNIMLDFESIRLMSVEQLAEAKFPMIILKTPKGWTGPKSYAGDKLEGNALSHQVVLTEAKTNANQLQELERWLHSYKFLELFDPERGLSKELKEIIPDQDQKMGLNPIAHGLECKELKLPTTGIAIDIEVARTNASSMRGIGHYLAELIKSNGDNFRIFSPDETYSNKIDDVFAVTSRAFRPRIEPWDKDLALDGRVIEMLSEHSLQGILQGYVLTGRHGILVSYEAFLQVIASMADQYAKFIRIANNIKWRGDLASINYILTSPGWRQEHNGFSHQNPGFIDIMLHKHGDFVNVYFPVDHNTSICILEKCLQTKNSINLIVAGKSDEPQWMSMDQAKKYVEEGVSVWDFVSDDNPDIVLAAIGDYLTKETLLAIHFIKRIRPSIRIRFVNIMELSIFCAGSTGLCRIDKPRFDILFTTDAPIIFNFHGYPETLKQVLFDYNNSAREIIIHGYIEVGSITTPLDMHVRNNTSRYHLAKDVFELLEKRGKVSPDEKNKVHNDINEFLRKHKEYIKEHGIDIDEETNFNWYS